MLSITRYTIKNPRLSPWVKFLWSFTMKDGRISHQLLPANTVDLLVNCSGTMKYYAENMDYHAPYIHINGLRRDHSIIRHTGDIKVYGVSFYAWGLYPVIQGRVAETKDRIVNLYSINTTLASKFDNVINNCTQNEIFENMEQALCTELRVNQHDLYNAALIEEFLRSDDTASVNQYCAERRINIKTFERITVKYTGYSPKTLHRLRRFQSASNQLVHQQEMNLAGITYDNRFADQSHFIKDFREFTGVPPRTFQNVKNSVKENAIYKII